MTSKTIRESKALRIAITDLDFLKDRFPFIDIDGIHKIEARKFLKEVIGYEPKRSLSDSHSRMKKILKTYSDTDIETILNHPEMVKEIIKTKMERDKNGRNTGKK